MFYVQFCSLFITCYLSITTHILNNQTQFITHDGSATFCSLHHSNCVCFLHLIWFSLAWFGLGQKPHGFPCINLKSLYDSVVTPSCIENDQQNASIHAFQQIQDKHGNFFYMTKKNIVQTHTFNDLLTVDPHIFHRSYFASLPLDCLFFQLILACTI